MRDFSTRLRESREEFKSVRSLTLCAILIGVGMAVSYFNIRISTSFQIGFVGIPNAMLAMLFGPFMAPCAAVASDVLNYMAAPNGGFFPGFTLTGMVAAFIRGAFYYHKPLSLARLAIAEVLVALICSSAMNTLWLYMMYGRGVLLGVPMRIVAALLLAAVNASVTFVLMKALQRAGVLNPTNRKEQRG